MDEPVIEAPVLVPRAGQVLDYHVKLHDRLARPDHFTAQFFHTFAKDVFNKNGVEWGSRMFFPYAAWADVSAARMWCGDLAKSLFQARTFQVTAEMVDAVTAIYERRVSAADAEGDPRLFKADGRPRSLMHVEEHELPAPHGFVWLDKPHTGLDRWGRVVCDRALTWGLVSVRYHDGQTMPGLRLTSWYLVGDPDSYDGQRPDDLESRLGPLILNHTSVFPFGERIPAGREVEGAITSDNLIAWAHALWVFMDTEIVAQPKPPIDRAARRRTLRSIKQNEVTVVLLRKIAARPHEEDGEHQAIDWTCRWLVSGHWRHLSRYEVTRHHALPGPGGRCLTCDEQITWIKPYIKGPDGLPLRATDKLYKLAR